jgi:hypothetical protein
MSASLPGKRDPPSSQYDLNTYWGRVRHAADISDPRFAPLTLRVLSIQLLIL